MHAPRGHNNEGTSLHSNTSTLSSTSIHFLRIGFKTSCPSLFKTKRVVEHCNLFSQMKLVRFRNQVEMTAESSISLTYTGPFDENETKTTEESKPKRVATIQANKNNAVLVAKLRLPVTRAPRTEDYSRTSGLFQCNVIVEKNRYILYYRHSKIPVLRADKQLTLKILPKYYIYDISGMQGGCNVPLEKDSTPYMGKICRDKDCNIHAFSLHPKRETIRSRQSLHILYEDSNPLVESNHIPRKVRVALYNEESDIRNRMNTLAEKVASSMKETKSLKHVAEPFSGLYTFSNKEPFKNEDGQWTLNFSNRCREASPANIQLQDENGKVLLQLARWQSHKFNLDFQAPFNAFQAFGFAIAQLCDY